MYRVMVIDDEEIVRRGICDLLDWEAEGFYICAEGCDGRDGLEKLQTEQPDVVLVDIKMPGMSGIELIRTAREAGYEGYFVILTGFSEFEFTKSAIRYGVSEYLLKPIDEDELLDIMRRLHKEIARKEGEAAFHSSNEAVARKELLRRILLRQGEREELAQSLEQYGMDYAHQIFCAAVISDPDAVQDELFADRVAELSDASDVYGDKVMMDHYMVVVRKDTDYRTWAKQLRVRNERQREKYGKAFHIAVGHNVSSWYDLVHSYEFAAFLLQHRFLFDEDEVLTVDSIEDRQNPAENPSTDYFCMLIEVGDMEGIENSVHRFKQFCKRTLMKEMDIKIQVLYNLMQIRMWAEKKYDNAPEQEFSDLMRRVNEVEKLDELMDAYCSTLQELCIRVGYAGTETVIKRMYYYMERNYDKDLKLETFAKMFHYNSSYLGKVFRKEIGDSFNTILDMIRIANARRLLKETDMKVYQISERVGYTSTDYFYLKFRKYVGITPKEYKRECQAGEG